MQHRHWTPDHRDAVLRRVSAVTIGTAVVGAAGAFGLGFGMVSAAAAADAVKSSAGGAVRTVAGAPTSAPTHAAATKKPSAAKPSTTKQAAPTKKAWTPPPAPPAPAPAPTQAAATSGGS
ncbi:MAG: hypothetical protein AB7O74_12450 [Candidatus Nanopelagicales bacterium]